MTGGQRLSEADWQQVVIDYARANGWLVYHTHDSRRSTPGFPDLVLVRGTVRYAELKTQTGKTSPAQDEWLDALRDAGELVHVWRPSDWPAVQDALRRGKGPLDDHLDRAVLP